MAGLAPARPVPTWPVLRNLSLQARLYLASHRRLAPAWIIHTLQQKEDLAWIGSVLMAYDFGAKPNHMEQVWHSCVNYDNSCYY